MTVVGGVCDLVIARTGTPQENGQSSNNHKKAKTAS
jgi:hypothetical protein